MRTETAGKAAAYSYIQVIFAVLLGWAVFAEVPSLWADLAQQYDGQDRWYLEALGIAADQQWNACLDAWLKQAGDRAWSTSAGRDIVWRSRAKRTPELLAKIVTDPKTPVETHPRYMRAFDFLSGPEKDQALKAILLGL